jgi:hypothetical protein
MKNVALVAAHFPPSNLAGVHRARLWAQHLHEFGWRPIIVTTHWRHYEESLDWELAELVEGDLEITRTSALPTRPIRVIGDIGMRGLPWHFRAVRRLFQERRIDFLHITVPSFYSATLGQLLYRARPIPFGIDYIDPWVHVLPEAEKRYSKAWISLKLGEALEPWAVRNASLITGVAEGYYAGVLDRNPHLRCQAVYSAMPYGNSARDFQSIRERPRRPYLFDPDDGRFHMVYAGAMLPKGYAVLDRLLESLGCIKRQVPDVAEKLCLHFVGTGKSPDDRTGYNVRPIAQRLGVDDIVSEHPHRIPYVDVLSHLTQSSAILVLGSTEPHYTPSKVYQAVQARRPVFALLHRDSSALSVLEESGAGVVVPLCESELPSSGALAARLASFVRDPGYDPSRVRWARFDAFSAKESARKLAVALDEAWGRFHARGSA